MPSGKVRSLLEDAGGRSRYGVSTSSNRQAQLKRVHGELRLDLEAIRERRKRLHESTRHHPIAGEDVAEPFTEEVAHQARQHPVAETMYPRDTRARRDLLSAHRSPCRCDPGASRFTSVGALAAS